MAEAATALADFKDILKFKEPLGPYTFLKLGGPADALAEPRDVVELSRLVRCCQDARIAVRVLGGGGNLLVRDEGVRGVVVRLTAAPFKQISVQGTRVRAGCGASLAQLIAESTTQSLAGLEPLVGIPGSVGGALRHNTSDRSVEVGQFVRLIEVIDNFGNVRSRGSDDLRFSYGVCHLDDPVFVAAEFELERDTADAITKRMRKAWIQRKATQPYSFQAAARIFRNPAGLSAAALLEQAGLIGAKVGNAQVSERDANYIVVEGGATPRDVLRLIDLMRTRVRERFHIDLDLELSIW